MYKHELLAKVNELADDKFIICQVVGSEPGSPVWNCGFDLLPACAMHPGLNILTVSHPQLKRLPTEKTMHGILDMCDRGHEFIKLPNHPTKDGKARCPYCMAIDLNKKD